MRTSHKIIAAVVIIVSLLTPIFLPSLISCSTVFSDKKYTAGDILGYIGALSASIITILGLSWTFSDNRHGIKEQARLDVLPFIGVNRLNKEYRLSVLSHVMDVDADSQAIRKQEQDLYYKEYKLDSVFFIIEGETVKAAPNLSEKQQELVLHNGKAFEQIMKGAQALVSKQLFFIPIEICNVGNGPAIDVRLSLNSVKTVKKKYILPVTLSVGEKVYVGIYCEADKIKKPADYCFDIYYKDVFGNVYRQSSDLCIKEDGSGAVIIFNTETKQEEVSKKELQKIYEMDKTA